MEIPSAPLVLRRGPSDPKLDDDSLRDLLVDDDESTGRPRIRCPHCGWTPGSGDRWMCLCGCAWNTFDTGGRCPDCGRQWHETQCLRCHRWSRHDDWYVEEGD